MTPRRTILAGGAGLIALCSGLITGRIVRATPSTDRALASIEDALATKGMRAGQPVFIRIFKKERQLELLLKNGASFSIFKTYPICAYSGQLGPKLKEGDRQAPEGFYYVRKEGLNPNSRFHLSFNLGFPNAYDRAHDRTGSYLMVHGSCVSIGCYAMTNEGIEEIYGLASAALDGDQTFFRVHIFPFRMTEENLDLYADSEWSEFWRNLKEGYDHFEDARLPPNVTVRGKRYHFDSMETPK